jgi:hypothetical protein
VGVVAVAAAEIVVVAAAATVVASQSVSMSASGNFSGALFILYIRRQKDFYPQIALWLQLIQAVSIQLIDFFKYILEHML